MGNNHPNATPNMVFTGARERPAKGPAPVLAAFGNLTTLNFLKANWGPLDDAMAVSDSVTFARIYGSDALDIDLPYFNYQTVLATGLMGKAVAQFLLRVADASVKKAGSRLMLEYVKSDNDPYERNLDGSYKLDAQKAKIPTGSTVAGYNARFLLELSDGTLVTGTGASSAGGLVGKVDEVSTIVPIADLEATYFGTRGNNILTSLFQPKHNNATPVDVATIEMKGSMLYRMAFRENTAGGGSTVPWYTVDGSESFDFALEPKLRNKNKATVDFDTMYREKHKLGNQLTNAANITGPIDGIKWYHDNIKTALELFHTAEKAARASLGDNSVWIHETNVYSINLFGGTNHLGIPYRAINHVPLTATAVDNRQVILSNGGAVINMAGAHDGDLSDAAYNQAIRDVMVNFGYGVPLTDIKHYPFHWVWDMGLETATTQALYNILAHRVDVAVVGATHEHGYVDTMDETYDKLVAIYATAKLIPESVIYSTTATRGAIVPYAARIKGSQYKEPISLGYSLAMKMADYLGKGNLVWDVDRDPMHKDNKNIDDEILNYQYKPFSFREKMWQSQAVAIESTGHNRIGLMGLQSINANDSSPLNSLLVVAGMMQATWAMAMAHGAWCGGTMSPAVIISRCNETIAEYVKGVDTSKLIITPNTQITPDDANNQFSYTMSCDLKCGTQYTAATITIDASFFDVVV